ncbi:Ribonuclease H [Lasiodiplodia hormozganensis]|uniref:ribonuclease H n=1 Tax=Lasiodiplodia hormozganensis TaxID=869390 RepID=A0AA39TG03_9PEZI|nr:Ribonuclease H [Lasiodiplodia hormozganensis]
MATDQFGEPVRRLFKPSLDRCSMNIPFSELVVYNQQKQISQLQFTTMARPQPARDESTLVIYIDGACQGNGTPSAKASYGVYVGPSSCYNTNGLLSPSLPQTSTRAEIAALECALGVIYNITQDDFKLSRIKIATDSKYLVQSMSKWIEGWIDNGGFNAQGDPVVHFEKLKELHERLDEMEYGDDGGLEIQFWHIPRDVNKEADALAGAALSSVSRE